MNAQQLKNSILQEAIKGRLVPQDPNDEPASVLLDKIRKEKAKLAKADNVVILDKGKVIAKGTPSQLKTEYASSRRVPKPLIYGTTSILYVGLL